MTVNIWKQASEKQLGFSISRDLEEQLRQTTGWNGLGTAGFAWWRGTG